MKIVLCLAVFLFSHCFIHTMVASFSFKDVTSWAFGYKQETMHKEFPCDHECTLILENHTGSIYIKTWSLPKIAIQGVKNAKEKELDCVEMETITGDSTVTIKTIIDEKKVKGDVDYFIIVPPHINVKVATHTGSIKIKNIQGTVQAKVQSGFIEVHEAQNDLFLKNAYGGVTVTTKELHPSTHILIESQGAIMVYLPCACNADIHAKTHAGVVTSDLYVTLKPITTKLNSQAWNTFKKEVNAFLGKGGAEVKLVSVNGNIKIMEY